MLEKDGGCTLEELLDEDENCLNQCKAANQKLTEFMCQRSTLQKLVAFATMMPSDVESHAIAHQYPFAAADILCSSKTISQALIEGGWQVKPDDDDVSGDEKKSE